MSHHPSKKCREYYGYKTQKALHEHYKSLFKVAADEHRFGLLCVDHLTNTLEEITKISNDPIAKKIAINALERHMIDKLCHTRTLFPNPKGFNFK